MSDQTKIARRAWAKRLVLLVIPRMPEDTLAWAELDKLITRMAEELELYEQELRRFNDREEGKKGP